jgi:hypothetical protein
MLDAFQVAEKRPGAYQECAQLVLALASEQDSAAVAERTALKEQHEVLQRQHTQVLARGRDLSRGHATLERGQTQESALLDNQELVQSLQMALDRPQIPPAQQLAAGWMEALVQYAPNMGMLAQLSQARSTDGKSGLLQLHLEELRPTFVHKLEKFPFVSAEHLQLLGGLVAQHGELRHPQIASALLDNKSADEYQLREQMVRLVGVVLQNTAASQRQQASAELPQDLQRLVFSTRRWLGRKHTAASAGKKEKGKSLGQEERVAALSAAVDDAEHLFGVATLATHAGQAIEGELARCHFFGGNQLDQLQALCTVGGGPSGFRESWTRHNGGRKGYARHEQVAAFLSRQACDLVRQVASGVGSAQAERVLNVLAAHLSGGSDLSFVLMHALLGVTWTVSSTSQLHSGLSILLAECATWQRVLGMVGSTKLPKGQGRLGALFADAKAILSGVSNQIVKGTGPVSDGRQVLAGRESFAALAQLLGAAAVPPEQLDALATKIAQFDEDLAQLATFRSSYCNCGVPIDSSAVEAVVDALNRGKEGLRLCDLQSQFNEVQCLPWLPWLYALRKSNLLLGMYRETGLALAEAEPRQGDGELRLLSQQRVVEALLPQLAEQWQALAAQLREGTMTCRRMEQVFGAVGQAESLQEVDFLATTGGKGTKLKKGGCLEVTRKLEWAEGAFQKVKDFQLLRALRSAIPRLLKLREWLSVRFRTESDPFVETLGALHRRLEKDWDTFTLASAAKATAGVKGTFQSMSVEQLEYVSELGCTEELVQYLLANQDSTEFQTQMSVCKEFVDDPRHISSLAALAHTRTTVSKLLYSEQFASLQNLLEYWATVRIQHEDLQRLDVMNKNFASVKSEVFEKQKRGVGVEAYHELAHLSKSGVFNFNIAKAGSFDFEENDKACRMTCTVADDAVQQASTSDQQLAADVLAALQRECAVPGAQYPHITDNAEKALGRELTADEKQWVTATLRNDAGETQAPAERVEGQAYLLELRSKLVMSDPPEALADELGVSDLFQLREAFVAQLQVLDDIGVAVNKLYELGQASYQPGYAWSFRFDGAPGSRESLQQHLQALNDEIANWSSTVSDARKRHYFLNFFTLLEVLALDQLLERCADEEELLPIYAELQTYEGTGASKKVERQALRAKAKAVEDKPGYVGCRGTHAAHAAAAAEWSRQLQDTLHLVTTRTDLERVKRGVGAWKELRRGGTPPIECLGSMLHGIFDGHCHVREVPKPQQKKGAQADLLVNSKASDGTRPLPAFVAAAHTPGNVSLVIDVVLTVYAWRGRLPEPGETLFCTSSTSIEQIELLMRRFFDAGAHGREHFVYIMADVHLLSATQQCAVVELLEDLKVEYGTGNAATLLMLSGKSNVMLLNALSSSKVELEPLNKVELQAVCQAAFDNHLGKTVAVTSNINGGGKSFHIKNQVAGMQKAEGAVDYVRVPFRESSNATTLLERLAGAHAGSDTPMAFHVDIGHVIPACANTVLFQLLMIGILRDDSPRSSKVYHRRPTDVFLLEIPNSAGNKTAKALRFLSTFLPTTRVTVGIDDISLEMPVFTDETCRQVRTERNAAMEYTCKYIRAFQNDIFNGKERAKYKNNWKPQTDFDITARECFALLTSEDGACSGVLPSFALFNNYNQFMHQTFRTMSSVPYFAFNFPALREFKHPFVRMLIDTSRDFCLRSVAVSDQRGRDEDAWGAAGGGPTAGGGAASSQDLQRQYSSSRGGASGRSMANAQATLAAQSSELLTRQHSDDQMDRWGQGSKKFEDSDHPLALFLKFDGVCFVCVRECVVCACACVCVCVCVCVAWCAACLCRCVSVLTFGSLVHLPPLQRQTFP